MTNLSPKANASFIMSKMLIASMGDIVVVALHTGLPNDVINGIGAWYTISRILFGLAYVFIESETLSFSRSVLWWSGNISCITALVLGGRKL